MIHNLDGQAPLFGSTGKLEVAATRDDLALLFNVTGAMINKLTKQGMPKRSHGKYDLAECVQWYIDFWRQRAAGNGSRELTDERRDLVIAQTERTNLENARLRAELIEADRAAAVLNEIAAIVASALDGLAGRASTDVAALDNVAEVQEVLFRECRLIRSSIADRVAAFALAVDSVDDTQTAAEPDSRPMGRRKQSIAGREPRAGAVA